jgi:hypothetical protein
MQSMQQPELLSVCCIFGSSRALQLVAEESCMA